MKPLLHIRIAVTRAAAQADDLAAGLTALGAAVLIAPLIRIVPSIDRERLDAVLATIADIDWIIFTSSNGVDAFMAAAHARGVQVPAAVRVACVGPATAASAARHGLTTTLMPDEFVGERIAEALAARGDLRATRILLPRARDARTALPDALRAAGASVDEVELYRSEPDPEGARVLRERVREGAIDLLTFTSPSTVRSFVEQVGEPGAASVAVIGPVTAAAARESGLRVDIEAEPHTSEGLIAVIAAYYAARAAHGETK